MDKAAHVALYGNVGIERRYCDDCKRFAFVIDGRIQCCDERVESVLKKPRRRISDVVTARNHPRAKDQKRILREQDWKCFWCDKEFGKSVWRKNVRTVLKVNWDHLVPFSYCANNNSSNFVASCQICNNIKHSLIFNSVEECRVHIFNKRKEKGYTDVRPMWGEVHRETATSEVL